MFSSLNLNKLNKFFKKISKPAKHGRKIGKGLASIGSVKNNTASDVNVAIGQGVGMIALPAMVFGINRLMKRLSKPKRKLFALAATTGITVGGYVGDLAAYGNMTSLSSSFNGMLGIVGGLIFTTGLFFLAPWLHRKINERRARKSQQPEQQKLFTKSLYARLNTGLEFGATIGAGLGATLEFALPGWGFIAAATGAVIGAPIGALAFILAPKLMARYRSGQTARGQQKRKSEINPDLMNFKSGVGIGATAGSMLGIIIGSILFPGAGTVLGGIVGAAIGGIIVGTITALAPSLMHTFNHPHLAESKLKKFGNYLYSAMTCIKTFAPLGSALGALIGTFAFPGIGTLVGIAIGGIVACAIGLATPKISAWYENRKLKTATAHQAITGTASTKKSASFTELLNKSKAIISFAASIGGVIGGIAGTFLMPGVGSALGAALGAGIAAVLAITCVIILPKIFRYAKKQNNEKIEREKLIGLEEIHPQPHAGLDLEPLPAIITAPKTAQKQYSYREITQSLTDSSASIELSTICALPPKSSKPKHFIQQIKNENSAYTNLNHFAVKKTVVQPNTSAALKIGRMC